MKTTTHLPEPELVPVREAMRRLGIGETTIFALLKNGTLESVKIGNKRLIRSASIRYVIENGAKTPPKPKKNEAACAA